MYAIKTAQFEGPIDLLLALIEEYKLSINEISLAEIADQYVSYLNSLEELPYYEIADFLRVAATLILIKSKSLLPQMIFTEEENIDIYELQRRLEFHKTISLAAKIIENNFQKNVLRNREKFLGLKAVFSPSRNLTVQNLFLSLRSLIEFLPEKEVLPEKFIKQTISLESKIKEIKDRFAELKNLNFKNLNNSNDKTEFILNFLAILELVRQGFLLAVQETQNEDILIEKL